MATRVIQAVYRAALVSWAISALGDEPLRISPRPGSEAAGLDVSHPDLPGNTIEFRTCEAVLDGNRDCGLFRVKLGMPGSQQVPAWSTNDGSFRYEWTYPEGIVVRFQATALTGRVELVYTVVNRTTAPLERVHLHTCVTTTEAPLFFPRLTPRLDSQLPPDAKDQDYTELFSRLCVWKHGRPFVFDSTEHGRRQPHLSLMPEGLAPIQWAWWINSTNTFDEPLIALSSHDRQWTAALWFERAAWASANAGDSRACLHLFPLFGRIEPGGSATVRGAFFLLHGGPAELPRGHSCIPEARTSGLRLGAGDRSALAGVNAAPDFFVMDNGVGRGKWTPEQQARTLKELGYAGISYNYTKPENLARWQEAFKREGLKVYGLYFLTSLGQPQPYDPRLPEAIRMLRGTDTAFWMTIGKPKTGGDHEGEAVEVVRRIADLARESSVRVALYGHAGFYMANATDALRLATKARRPNVGTTINLCHEFMSGRADQLDETLKAVAPSAILASINGVDPGAQQYILRLDQGSFDMVRYLKKLLAAGYTGPVGLQCYNVPGDIRENLAANIAAWRKIISRLDEQPKKSEILHSTKKALDP